jgi:hypothetical protein
LIRGDLDEKNFHFAKLRVTHLVRSLRQPEGPPGHERERKRFPDRFGSDAERARFRKFHGQRAIRENDLEILIEAGRELFARNFIDLEHGGRLLRRTFKITENLTTDDAD